MKKIDFLSPPITLFHLERRTHTSKIGGGLIIFMSCLYLAYIIYLFYNLITHNKITSIFYKRFQLEAGYYSFNSSSLFHFIQIFSTNEGGYFDKFEKKYIRAYTTYTKTNFNFSDLDLYDHWIFDLCEKNVDDKNLDQKLFENIVNFTNAVCIKYYYNSTLKKYFYLDEEGFTWPHLEHGMAHRNNIYLTTSVQMCKNNSIMNNILGNCGPQEEIDKYLNKYKFLYLHFTNTQIDPTNYNIPIQQYFQTITTSIGNEINLIENYIYYSPLKLKTYEGALFSGSHEINSYCFDYNRKGSAKNDINILTLTKYYHLMQNNVQIYERRYNNIVDLLSEIGGVFQSIFYLFFWINYIYNKYVIAFDTNSLFFAVKDDNEKSKNKKNKKIKGLINKKPAKKYESLTNNNNPLKLTLLKKKDDEKIINNINKTNEKEKNDSNKYCPINAVRLNNSRKFKTLICPNNIKLYNEQNSSIICLQDNSSKNKINEIKKQLNFNIIKNDIIKKEVTGYIKKDEISKFWLSRESLSKIDHKKMKIEEILDKENKKIIKNISFFKFLKDIIVENKKGSNYFLIKFRKHLLSEEHLFKSHVKTVLLEKQCKSNRNRTTNIFECFNEL